MSFAKYAQFYKDNGFFTGSKIKATITDNSFIGKELVLSKGNNVLQTKTIPANGKVEFFTDDSGMLTLSSDSGTSTISGSIEIGAYATYNITLDGVGSDKSRQVYASKASVTLNAETTSDTVSVSYTGDVSNLTVTSSNRNVANVTLNGNTVTITDAGKGLKGKSDVKVSVSATSKYNAKDVHINVEKTNGEIDKSWTGLKNIVESEQEATLCEVGEEYEVSLSNGRTITYIIGAIDHDYDHQLIFVPKRYDYLDRMAFNNNSNNNRWRDSNIRSYLNSTFLNMLPSDLSSVISEKDIQYATGNTTLEQTFDKIWLPREIEVMNTTINAYEKEREIYRIGRFACFASNMVTVKYGNSDEVLLVSPYSNYDQVTIENGSSAGTGEGTSYDSDWTGRASLARIFPCFHIIKDE